MTKKSKGKCEAASHKLLKEKERNRVQKLQGMVVNIQIAMKEGRTADVDTLADQMHGMLCGWGAEPNDPPPASSSHGGSHGSLGSFSEELAQFEKQQYDEKDDAESNFKESTEDFIISSKVPPEDIFQGLDLDQCHIVSDFPDLTTQMNDNHYVVPNVMPGICPPASAFWGPKCALWDCSRPAQVLCQGYCSSGHALLARNEGRPGNTPVWRPGGILLKDGSLFAALNAKTQGKDVGIPNCDGAATLRSPWNDSELFDLSLFEGETLREWLFLVGLEEPVGVEIRSRGHSQSTAGVVGMDQESR